MKVSIVTISFNQAEFLEEAILSVLNQDYSDIEYIVVDPGSTDGSREIIEKYRGKISHILLDSDDGPADGLNKGFAVASGEIYGFLNADDILLDGTVSRFVDVFKNHQIDVVSGHGYIIDSSSQKVRQLFSDRFNLKNYVYGSCVLLQQSTFFKMNMFNAVGGFNQNNCSCWDGELWFDMAVKGAKFKRIGGYYSGFRIYDESITGSGRLQNEYDATYRRHALELGIIGIDKKINKRLNWIQARLCDPVLTFKRLMVKIF